ncbi:MAG: hypothetical protein KAR65_01195 [Anaerolineales bacterium]|nr:hypothetical protein [Anaerolineales bacterium]
MNAAQEWLLEAKDLKPINGDDEEFRALDGVDFQIKHGKLMAITRPCDSGKSAF